MTIKTFPELSIAIPASIVADIPHLREKTLRIGLIGRASAIFRVNEIIIYPDLSRHDQYQDSKLMFSILSYMETPQYLRKHLFSLKPSLRYVGVLPPLRTLHHPTANLVKDLKIGELREGIILESNSKRSLVYVGVERLANLQGLELPVGGRVTVKFVNFHRGIPFVSLTKREDIDVYWGYRVSVSKRTIGQILKHEVNKLKIATSKYGKPFNKLLEIEAIYKKSRRILFVFGSPDKGLKELLQNENLDIYELVDFVVNTIPLQGTKTVRTEEAIFASLSVFNIIS
jgi:predicted SPOUT superfamily RNA methylase MTH1